MKKASPPSSIKVGPFVYTVRVDEDAVNRRDLSSRDSSEGYTDTAAHEIVIRQTADAKRTLLHELLHALFELSGMDVQMAERCKGIEEDAIQSLDGTLLMALRDNPEMVKFLVK